LDTGFHSVAMTRRWSLRTLVDVIALALGCRSARVTWYYHAIPIAEYIKNGERKKD